jgi:hypothetical protein
MPEVDRYGFPIIEDGDEYRIVRSPSWPHEYRVVWIKLDLYRWALTLRGARRIRARLERDGWR